MEQKVALSKAILMTFIVNQDGVFYQKDLGKKTEAVGKAMKVYNPIRLCSSRKCSSTRACPLESSTSSLAMA